MEETILKIILMIFFSIIDSDDFNLSPIESKVSTQSYIELRYNGNTEHSNHFPFNFFNANLFSLSNFHLTVSENDIYIINEKNISQIENLEYEYEYEYKNLKNKKDEEQKSLVVVFETKISYLIIKKLKKIPKNTLFLIPDAFNDNKIQKDIKLGLLSNGNFASFLKKLKREQNDSKILNVVYNIEVSPYYPLGFYLHFPLACFILTIIVFLIFSVKYRFTSDDYKLHIHHNCIYQLLLMMFILLIDRIYTKLEKEKSLYGIIKFWKLFLSKFNLLIANTILKSHLFILFILIAKGWMLFNFENKKIFILKYCLILSFSEIIIEVLLYVQFDNNARLVINIFKIFEFLIFFIIFTVIFIKPAKFFTRQLKYLNNTNMEYYSIKKKTFIIFFMFILVIFYSYCSFCIIMANHTVLNRYVLEEDDDLMQTSCEILLNFITSVLFVFAFIPMQLPMMFSMGSDILEKYSELDNVESEIKVKLPSIGKLMDYNWKGFSLRKYRRNGEEVKMKLIKDKSRFIIFNPIFKKDVEKKGKDKLNKYFNCFSFGEVKSE